MPELSHIDPRSAALLVMEYQVDTLTKFMTAAQCADAMACVPDLIATARDAGMMVLHVVVVFRPGHPEVSPRNPCSGGQERRYRGKLVSAPRPSGRRECSTVSRPMKLISSPAWRCRSMAVHWFGSAD